MARQTRKEREANASQEKNTHPTLVGTARLGPVDGAAWHAFFAAFHPSLGRAPTGRFSAGHGSAGCFPCERPATACSPAGAASDAFRSHLLEMGPASPSAADCVAPRAPLRSSALSSGHSCNGSEFRESPAWSDPPAPASSGRSSPSSTTSSPGSSSPSETSQSGCKSCGCGPSCVSWLGNLCSRSRCAHASR